MTDPEVASQILAALEPRPHHGRRMTGLSVQSLGPCGLAALALMACRDCGRLATTEYDYGPKFYTCAEHELDGDFYGCVRSLDPANPIAEVRGTNPGTSAPESSPKPVT